RRRAPAQPRHGGRRSWVAPPMHRDRSICARCRGNDHDPEERPMTTTTAPAPASTTATAPDADREAALVARAAACGPVLAEHAARVDAEGVWPTASFEHLRDAGLLKIAVPTELGGDGATIRQVAMVQRE